MPLPPVQDPESSMGTGDPAGNPGTGDPTGNPGAGDPADIPGAEQLFAQSKLVLVGGVNSPVRAMRPYPFFTARAAGAYLWDTEGNRYQDHCLAYGPMVLGHAHPVIAKAISDRLPDGWLYGTPTEPEIRYAELLAKHVPGVEVIRTVNTGTEATATALRLARGITGRSRVIKMIGGFHGAHDAMLVKAGSGAMTHGVPDSAGVPPEVADATTLVPFNDLPALGEALEAGPPVAALMIEPVMGNIGCIPPEQGYLGGLRKLCDDHGTMLILDEVITGFRLALGGAQEFYDIRADIVTLGKVVGGGLPIGVIGGSREVMANLTPGGSVYNAGTFNGNPLTIAAGLATIEYLVANDGPGQLNAKGEAYRKLLSEELEKLDLTHSLQGVGSMTALYLGAGPVRDAEAALACDQDRFLRMQQDLMRAGLFLPPSQFECNFLSLAHTDEDLASAAAAIGKALGT